MTVLDILNLCNQNGIKVRLKQGNLAVTAKNGISNEIAAQLKEYKAQIVGFLANHQQSQSQGIQRLEPGQTRGLSFAQERMCFVQNFIGASAVYNISFAVRLHGQLDVRLLSQSVETIINRHDTLRTRFVEKNGQSVQIIDPEITLDLIEEDASSEQMLRAIYLQERESAFDLATQRPIRVRLARESDHSHVLLVTMHHIISDGLSIEIFFRELSVLYAAQLLGQVNPMPPLDIQYVDYAAWQRRQLNDDKLKTQLQYWQQQLSDLPPCLELPTDFPRPAKQSFNGRSQSITLPKSLSDGLKQLSKDKRKMLLILIFL